MQKSLIVLVLGLLAVGCTSLRDRVIGEYEHKFENRITVKRVFLDNGIVERYKNGKETTDAKWAIVKEEIHVNEFEVLIEVYRINTDKSITSIAVLANGNRTDYSKEQQDTLKKIK